MEARAALVVERLGHEGGPLTLTAGELLDGRLELERAVRGAHRLGVPQVDLELTAGELVVGGHHVQAVLPEHSQRVEQGVFRVAAQAGDVDVAGGLAVPAPAAGRGLVLVEQVELELGADEGAHAELGELVDDPAQHRAGALLGPATVGVEEVGDDAGHARLPRHRPDGLEIREGDDVRKSFAKTTFHVHDVAHRGGAVDGPAERHTVAGGAREVLHQQVPSPLAADQVGVGEADDVDAFRGEPACCRLES